MSVSSFRLACVALSLAAAPALAADLPLRGAIEPPPAEPLADSGWRGAYVGVFGGGALGETKTSTHVESTLLRFFPPVIPVTDAAGTNDLGLRGALAGVTVGYDADIADRFVIGVEGDFSAAPISGSTSVLGDVPVIGGLFAFHQSVRADWLATIRGRVGFNPTPNTLVYATGGLALTDQNYRNQYHNVYGETLDFHLGGVKAGWTLGGGIEHRFAANWSAKLEYLYTEFSKNSGVGYVQLTDGSFAHVTNNLAPMQMHTIRAGINYRFGSLGRL